MGKNTNAWNESLKKQIPGYERQMMQTYMTAPEWRNVEMAQEFGRFLQKGNAFYRFLYFKQIATFWNVFANSYRAARKHHSHKQILLSEYMLMNLFIGAFTTVGFLGLGLFSSAIFWFMKKENHSKFQTHVGKLVADYAAFIHEIPFYNYNYLSKIKPLWNAFKSSPSKSFADVITFITALCQLLVRATVSYPIAWWYNQPENQAADKIHLLVKDTLTEDQLLKVDKRVNLISRRTDPVKNKSLSHITIPRYEAFVEIVNKFVNKKVCIQKIASQDAIVFKVLTPKSKVSSLASFKTLYSYQNHLDKNKTVMLDVPVKEINKTVEKLKKDKIKIKLIHDF